MNDKTAERELRMGLVLYGGVSLCIYIFGVAYEFLRLVRRQGAYRELVDSAGVEPVVDIISGTSAGGINGLVLAKALATGADLEALKDLWIESGDLESLIDSHSKNPLSLLDSQNYQRLIEDALDAVERSADPAKNPPATILDLWITATDLDGVRYNFTDTLGGEIDTKFHNTVFHFKHRPEQTCEEGEQQQSGKSPLADSGAGQNHLLAKVAAATSSFPVAFAPVRLTAAEKQQMRALFGKQVCPAGMDRDSVYGDGGMLNNKPFSHTSSSIFRRQANRPVDRKLFYVEPDPGVPDGAPLLAERKPAANGLDTLTGLNKVKMHESITADLQQLHAWNGKIEELREDLESLEQSLQTALETLKAQQQSDKQGLRNLFQNQPQYASYQKLKIRLIQQKMAMAPAEGEDPGVFLRDLDYAFRIRRIRFFIDRISDWQAAADTEQHKRFFGGAGSFKGQLYECIEAYLKGARCIRKQYTSAEDVRAAFSELMQQGPEARVQQILADMEQDCAQLRTSPLTLQELYQAFEFFDMHIFPARQRSGLGEVDPVEIVRISPDRATRYIHGDNAVQEKLAGEKVMHFSAFLKKTWRENDLIWGRLDAAEIIVRTLLPDDEIAQKAMLDKLCPVIIKEELDSIRLRRMQEIDSGLLRNRFKEADQVKRILDEIATLTSATTNPGAIEDYFRNRYRVGAEELADLDQSAMLRTGAKGIRTLSRVLNWIPRQLQSAGEQAGGVAGAVKQGIATILQRVLKRLNQVADLIHLIVVTLRGDKYPLLAVLAVVGIAILITLLYNAFD
jgi:predicted acylesterase/phospholipase RssA